jgi:protein-S-isoprenylcysteine O-methyltransferase Ste14
VADERDQPLGELVGSLSSDLATLVRSEVALAAEETRNELRRAGQAAMAASAAVALGLLAAIAGVLTAGFALDEALPRWASFALVALALAAAAALAGVAARHRVRAIDPVPRQTQRTIQEDIRWMNNELKS